jgi:hypothetical protein
MLRKVQMVLRPIIPEKRTPTYTGFKKIRLRRDTFSDNSGTLHKVSIFFRAILMHYAYQLDDGELLPLFS